MEQLQHFSHEHMLSLVQLQLNHIHENSDKEDEDEDENQDKDDFVLEDPHVGKCMMCKEDIYSFHLCYYCCKACDYSLHKFCAQLPITQQNHPLHPGHNLTLSDGFQFDDPDFIFDYTFDTEVRCGICKIERERFYNYHCSICVFDIDIICATISEQKMEHPSHPHKLQRYFGKMISHCNACGNEHSGTFYHCTTCSWFKIHLDCALLPTKLLIQQFTNDIFSHPHLLNLAYSFPHVEIRAKFYPDCRVCGYGFTTDDWHYRCNKCQYYVHVQCATSTSDAFTSILMHAGLGKTYKNFKDADHPNLIRCPFPDESFNLLKRHLFNKDGFISKRKIDGEAFSHQHPLFLVDTLLDESVSLHDPMKKVELLCDGCVRPIMNVSFYKCSQHHCGFVLHEWCTRLPSEIQDHHDHPKHTLVLQPKVSGNSLGLFWCKICELPCNGFAYGCMQCSYKVDINCGFIPEVITHEAHPDHLLSRIKASVDLSKMDCKACFYKMQNRLGFHCPTCDFSLHIKCALLLPGTIRHKYDKHSLSLRYGPVENHSSAYFCDICEDECDMKRWFYHCSTCDSSMHTACAPLKFQYERSTSSKDVPVFEFLNVKFGRTLEIAKHPHPFTFIQGINTDGTCVVCHFPLQDSMIFKCFQCKFALHWWCE
ncbi:putative chromatin regulator PHD family [Helianthus annuus]|nr:putative chromatin regulator PHD family [Helianthus annuus]